jgi:hypothetical protein
MLRIPGRLLVIILSLLAAAGIVALFPPLITYLPADSTTSRGKSNSSARRAK